MKYFYIAKENIFNNKWQKVGELTLYTSRLFDDEQTCKGFANQYQSNHSCFIEIHTKEV